MNVKIEILEVNVCWFTLEGVLLNYVQKPSSLLQDCIRTTEW